MGDKTAFEGWAIVELMGHRRLAGLVSEAVQYGVPMLRLDVPGPSGTPLATQFYGGAALYCVTPTTEEIARAVAASSRPAPVQRWELPAATTERGSGMPVRGDAEDDEDDKELFEDDEDHDEGNGP